MVSHRGSVISSLLLTILRISTVPLTWSVTLVAIYRGWLFRVAAWWINWTKTWRNINWSKPGRELDWSWSGRNIKWPPTWFNRTRTRWWLAAWAGWIEWSTVSWRYSWSAETTSTTATTSRKARTKQMTKF